MTPKKKSNKQKSKPPKSIEKSIEPEVVNPPIMGRPKIEIDWEQMDKLLEIQGTLLECASWFNCSVDTIENKVKEKHGITFSEYSKQKSAKGRASLRRLQFQLAESGNPAILIWLGKQILKQTDIIQNEIIMKPMIIERNQGKEVILGAEGLSIEGDKDENNS